MDVYFDIFSGISGNMVLGALIDLGLNWEELNAELDKLGLSDEYELRVKEIDKKGITATYVDVKLKGGHHSHHVHENNNCNNKSTNEAHKENNEHNQQNDNSTQHNNDHTNSRKLSDIERLINKSDLSSNIKQKSKQIFLNLAEAEAKIHNKKTEEIHFHEVGAVDAIVDIVGSVIGLDLLGIEKIYASRVNTGTGFVECDHGKLPVPAPATMELLQEVPLYSTGINKELVTPTGAAIITTLADGYGFRPEMKIEKTGYGAGSYNLEIPNLLRINMGEIISQKKKKRTLSC